MFCLIRVKKYREKKLKQKKIILLSEFQVASHMDPGQAERIFMACDKVNICKNYIYRTRGGAGGGEGWGEREEGWGVGDEKTRLFHRGKQPRHRNNRCSI
jgi:hypothetical protein